MAPRTKACNYILHLKRASYIQNDLHIYTPCWDFGHHNATPRLRRALHATTRTLESSRNSVATIALSRRQWELDRHRRHAFWVRKSPSLPRGARGFANTRALTSNVIEPSAENLPVKTGGADISHGDSTVSIRENDTDELETDLSPAAQNDIKIFRTIWKRGIINVSRDFKVFEDKGHSKFSIKLRIPKRAHDEEERKLRVRGELESTDKVRTYCPRELRISFF